MFELILYSVMTLSWGAFGYVIFHEEFYENVASAECENVTFENSRKPKYLESTHAFMATSWSTAYPASLKATYSLCLTPDNCVIKTDDASLYPHSIYNSKDTNLYLKLPKLKPGSYQYYVTTNVEGYRVLKAHKNCYFTIK